MPLSWNEIKSRALAFSREWQDESSEDAEAKSFWDGFFNIFGISRKRLAAFEEPVKKLGDRQGFIDLFWKGVLLVEHKSRGKNLDKAYTQALDYFPGIAERELPKYVLVSDFARFRLYDLEENQQHEFELQDLHKNVRLFGFIAGYQTHKIQEQDPVNVKAAERMGRLHDQMLDTGFSGHPLERYLVRLLFCLFAEDTGIFERQQFQDYIERRTGEDGADLAYHLAALFQVLNTPEPQRLKNLDEQLAAFPYVNGKLFEETLPMAAFVSTNSITQGEQVGALWGWLLAQGIKIHFAHRTFSWSNEARGNAAVHCVIVGFYLPSPASGRGAGGEGEPEKTLFEYEDIKGDAHAVRAANINPYLVDAPDMVLPRRSRPICNVPEIGIGNKPIDGGQYLFTPGEKAEFLAREPAAAPFFRRWIGAEEFINGHERWCLWLGDCPPEQLRAMPEAMKRVQAVKALRLASKSAPTQKLADTPTRFHVEFMPDGPFMVIPEVSSERRFYIPMGYLEPPTLASNKVRLLPNATLFDFGVLMSAMHMAWTRAVCGRLESRYQYSISIVYNNFPWPDIPSPPAPLPPAGEGSKSPSPIYGRGVVPAGGIPAGNGSEAARSGARERERIEAAAQSVLDTRTQFPGATLADLYDPLTMPPALLKAHQALDKAVDAAYGKSGFKTEAERVAFLFERYQQLTSLLPQGKPQKSAKPAKRL